MKPDQFFKISIEGSPEERGFSQGSRLSGRIHRTVEFYATIFNRTESEIFSRAKHFKQKIKGFRPDYAAEIEALAAGAAVDPLWIYALNARTEILAMSATECTSLYFSDARLLGQNWDWAHALEELLVLMEIRRPDGSAILMLTEPGIIGKIGMNSHGLGVCLNILRIGKQLDGVPVHILLRAILESESIVTAQAAVTQSGLGKASSIMVGDRFGKSLNVELAGDESFALPPAGRVRIHTNHYLARPLNADAGIFRCSYARQRMAEKLLSGEPSLSLETMKQVLRDRSDKDLPIYRKYIPHPVTQTIGTVCTVIMDLANLQMHIKKGNSAAARFYTCRLK
ncbi:MAG: C45 family peptidase [Thermodesulfobacteriota bacterium]